MHSGFLTACAICALWLAGIAQGSEQAQAREQRIVMPVLVTVNAEGKVIGMAPAYPLRADMRRLVGDAVNSMVSGPAYERGKPMSSQIVLKLVLVAQPLDSGNYSLRIEYAGSESLPYGTWRWATDSQNRLKLVNGVASLTSDPLQRRLDTQIQNIFNPRPHESY